MFVISLRGKQEYLMPRGLQLESYVAVGAAKDLDFIGEIYDKSELLRLATEFGYYVCGGTPRYAVNSTNWRCRLTGKIMNKQIAVVKRAEFGSRYQREFWETRDKYNALAERLGIIFLYNPGIEFFPVTTKTPCRWRGRDGSLVIASYHDLGYDIITVNRRSQLGIEARTIGAKYGF